MADLLAQVPALRRLQAQRLTTNLGAFARKAWPIIKPGKLKWSWHHDLICEYLQLARERVIKRLIINVPPRTTKSTLTSVCFPAWCWATEPSLSFIVASHNMDLSTEFAVLRRNLLTNAWYQRMWPKMVTFATDQNRKEQYENLARGQMLATSMTAGSVHGKGADFLLIDDPISPTSSYSDVEREAVNRDFDSVFRSRLNDPEQGGIIIIMQRLHEEDLSGHVLMTEPSRWTHLRLPMVSPEEERIVFPVSGRVVVRKPGGLLHETRFSHEWCEREEAGIGSYAWSGQYQQAPSPAQGGIIKKSWWRFYVRPGVSKPEGCLVLPEKFDEVAMAWDLSFKNTQTSDFVCGGVWGRVGAMKYLLDIFWERADFVQTKRAVRNLSEKWPAAYSKWIESAANGPAIVAELQTEISGLIAVPPIGTKEARLHAASPDVEAGNVVLPHPSMVPWVHRFIEECAAACCGGKHDDAADMLALAIDGFRKSSAVGQPSPFLIGERDGPWTQYRAALAGPSTFRSWGGFAEQRPILPVPAPTMSREAAEASKRIANGCSRPDDIDKVMWGSIGEF
jgi:predicted phage terminase large subunit-like protein